MAKLHNPEKRLCLALDVDNAKRAMEIVSQLKDYVGLFKVGLELFTSEGPAIVKKIMHLGADVFLDLKFHDIPHTAASVARVATRLGVTMFNLHAPGGSEMIKLAVSSSHEEAIRLGLTPPRILAVTVLTSINDEFLEKDLLIKLPMKEVVVHFAKLTKAAGADGVIASPQETALIRDSCGPDFCIVTPGVRPKSAGIDDQKRFMTPAEAIKSGSDFIVIGRPILSAVDPVIAAKEIIKEINLY